MAGGAVAIAAAGILALVVALVVNLGILRAIGPPAGPRSLGGSTLPWPAEVGPPVQLPSPNPSAGAAPPSPNASSGEPGEAGGDD